MDFMGELFDERPLTPPLAQVVVAEEVVEVLHLIQLAVVVEVLVDY